MTQRQAEFIETKHHSDLMMEEIHQIDPENRFFFVPGSQLHREIHEPMINDSDER